MHYFQDERSKVKVTRVVLIFGTVRSVPSSLFDRITSYVAYIQHMRRCVVHHFRKERSRSYRSFKVFTLSAPWLPPNCLVKQVKYVGIWSLRHAAAIRSLDLLVIKH